MAISLGNLLGQARAAVQSAADSISDSGAGVPEPLKNAAPGLADQFEQIATNPALLNQLGIPQTTPLPRLETKGAVKQAYAQGATTDLTNKKTLDQINAELKARDPNAKPVTAQEVRDLVAKTDVVPLSPRDYETLKMASGGQRQNPATSIEGSEREDLAANGPTNLATARLRQNQEKRDPTQAEIDQAAADLKKIDPGLFTKPAKDVIYVNEKHTNGVADPRQTKVASHEYLHLLLGKHGVPHSETVNGQPTDPQHAIIGRLGWNQAPGTSGQIIPGENRNWATPPGKGLPPE